MVIASPSDSAYISVLGPTNIERAADRTANLCEHSWPRAFFGGKKPNLHAYLKAVYEYTILENEIETVKK